MWKKGLTREQILRAAVALVEERGAPELSMRELAERLGVKTPSLYNHVASMEALLTEVCRYAVAQFTAAQLEAMEGLRGDEAVRALAGAYRAFARGRAGLYRAIVAIPAAQSEALTRTAAAVAEPALRALADYPFTKTQRQHWQRVLRSFLHGFAAQEQAGYFAHFPVPADESFALAVQCFLDGLHAALTGEA